ncbi:MAG: dihydrofolate reductase family protein [Pseudomonadota bacterium]
MVNLTLSCAVSSDGYLDDRSTERAILSSPEDLEAVLALRAQSDMIVVGAETLRRDNPSLATRGEDHLATRRAAGRADHPVKLVLTRSGKLPHDRAFFETGSAETIVLSRTETDAPGTVERFEGDPVDALLHIARSRDCRDVLIEGGAQILSLALPRARHLRLAVNPESLGDQGHARLFEDLELFLEPLDVIRTERLGDTQVYHIDLLRSRARPIMEEAFRLSERCPASKTAFAVGAVGCTAELAILATGYSRETGPTDHAEEAMLSKLDEPPHTVICTLEPCLNRESKPKGCAQRLVDAGVQRVFYAIAEDETFTRQSGLTFLDQNGVELIQISGFEEWFRKANQHIYGSAS